MNHRAITQKRTGILRDYKIYRSTVADVNEYGSESTKTKKVTLYTVITFLVLCQGIVS